jgi:hypothetical protein
VPSLARPAPRPLTLRLYVQTLKILPEFSFLHPPQNKLIA